MGIGDERDGRMTLIGICEAFVGWGIVRYWHV